MADGSDRQITMQRDTDTLNDVKLELARARSRHGSFASAHEGHSVILEEFHELEQWVFKKREHRDLDAMRHEAVQLAAMAMKFASDIAPARYGEEDRHA